MNEPENYSFIRYLEAKASVDDRALNRLVWDALEDQLKDYQAAGKLQILEVGGGIGTMLTLIDIDEANIQRACTYLRQWGDSNNWKVVQEEDCRLVIQKGIISVDVSLETADVYEFVEDQNRQWDVLIAHALLDLLDLDEALPRLFSVLCPGGIYYFTINYDGEMIFEPVLDLEQEKLIMGLYNKDMDERLSNGKPSGSSRTGRRLFATLKNLGASIIEAGGSDWVVYAVKDGYQDDEAYFLHYLINIVNIALEDHPLLDPKELSEWIAGRHLQIENGELVCMAHQLDFLGLGPE
jgi:SAM-dependent methyltransferase